MRFLNVRCDYKESCTSDSYHYQTCLRNKANKYEDKFSLNKGGYDPLHKWLGRKE